MSKKIGLLLILIGLVIFIVDQFPAALSLSIAGIALVKQKTDSNTAYFKLSPQHMQNGLFLNNYWFLPLKIRIC